MNKFKLLLRVLLTPSCWLQNNQYSSYWNKKLLNLMNENKFQLVNEYYASINGHNIWIANHPYASFSPATCKSVRPSRATILIAHDKLIEDII